MEYKELNLLILPIIDEKGQKLGNILGNVEISLSVVIYNEFVAIGEPTKVRPSNYKEMLNSGVLTSQKFESDENGNAVIDLTTMLSSRNFIKLINSYEGKYSFILNIKVSVFKTEKFYPYEGIISNRFEYNRLVDGITFNTLFLDDIITLESLEVKYKLSELKSELKRIEDLYTITKSNIEQKISLSDKEIEIVTEDYEPVNFNYVVTRLLEFKEGTLNPGLIFCEQFGLKKELDILKTFDRCILRMTQLYPNVTIDDGEGIPYSGPDKVDPVDPKQPESE
jgi:hypothetical protein